MVDDTIRGIWIDGALHVTKICLKLYPTVLQDIKQIRRFECLCDENICFCLISARNPRVVGSDKVKI